MTTPAAKHMQFAAVHFMAHTDPAGDCYSCEASQLRWPPGKWPEAFRIEGVSAIFIFQKTRTDAEGGVAAMEYIVADNPHLRATIWND
jgi:hypothetical protein